MLHFLFILMLNIHPATQSEPLFVARDSLFSESGILDLGSRDGWRFHPGDNLNRANPDFDDSDWMLYKPSGLTQPIPDSLWQGYGWFRFRFAADSSVLAKASYLYFSTWGAAEVYLDGKLVQKFGVFSTDLEGERRFNPFNNIFPAFVLQPADSHVLAVRLSYHKGQRYKELLGKYARTFGFDTGLATDYLNQKKFARDIQAVREFYILGTMLLLIVVLHLVLFILFPAERSNLYITILVSLLFLHIIVSYGGLFFEFDVLQRMLFRYIPYIVLFIAALTMFPFTISSMFNLKPKLIHKMLIWLFPLFAFANFILSGPAPNIFILFVLTSVIIFFSSQVLIKAWRNNSKGVWFIAGAVLCLILSAVASVVYSRYSANFRIGFQSVLNYLVYASVPLGLTAFMASRFRDLYTNLEQKVMERTRELNQSLEDLRSTQTRLIHSEKMASLGQLTAGIAHEIQNPLNFVNNFSEVGNELIEDMKSKLAVGSWQSAVEIADDLRQNLEKINLHGKRADAIVKGMLQHSRPHTGKKEPTDINVLCDEYLRLAYHGFRAKDKSFNVEYKTGFDPNLPKINVVPQDIGRVLLNLINNAFYAVDKKDKEQTPLIPPKGGIESPEEKYMPTVIVTTSHTLSRGEGRGEVRIVVKDNGPGIPFSIVDKIFQPFFTTKPTGEGTGLGLSISYDIVKAHKGELKVETKEGEGSEFIVLLPE